MFNVGARGLGAAHALPGGWSMYIVTCGGLASKDVVPPYRGDAYSIYGSLLLPTATKRCRITVLYFREHRPQNIMIDVIAPVVGASSGVIAPI